MLRDPSIVLRSLPFAPFSVEIVAEGGNGERSTEDGTIEKFHPPNNHRVLQNSRWYNTPQSRITRGITYIITDVINDATSDEVNHQYTAVVIS